MCLSWLLASKTCRVGVLWSRGRGTHTTRRSACRQLVLGGKSHRETRQRAAVSRHLEEKVPSDRIYTRQQRPSWQVNILVLVRPSNAALLCDGDVVSSLVFRFSHPKPYPFALVRTSFILRPHPPLTSDL